MTTIRDQIIEALLARLQTLYPAAERTTVRLLDSRLPASCLWDSTESGTNVQFGRQTARLQVNVAAADYMQPTDNASRIANRMIGDLIKTLIATDPALGGLAETVRYQNSDIAYPEPGGDWIVGVDLTLSVDYTTALGNPYS